MPLSISEAPPRVVGHGNYADFFQLQDGLGYHQIPVPLILDPQQQNKFRWRMDPPHRSPSPFPCKAEAMSCTKTNIVMEAKHQFGGPPLTGHVPRCCHLSYISELSADMMSRTEVLSDAMPQD
ncbi:hypothetical protein V2G26_009069 [Clonostachys chloroleuca]